jgi:hypothetical protein
MKAVLGSLTEAERALVRETERDRLADLDEDGLVELHGRIRRARDKYVKLYRRQAAARVVEHGGRGKAKPKNTRNAGKAEVFEDALARVSRSLAAAARASAAALKSERLQAARRVRSTPTPVVAAATPRARVAARAAPPRRERSPSVPGLRKRRATIRASGARKQARRDSR